MSAASAAARREAGSVLLKREILPRAFIRFWSETLALLKIEESWSTIDLGELAAKDLRLELANFWKTLIFLDRERYFMT